MAKKRRIYDPKPEFLERTQELFPYKKEYDVYIDILQKDPPLSLRCNTLKMQPSELKKRLENKGWKIKQPFKKNPEVMIVEGKTNKEEGDKTSSLGRVADIDKTSLLTSPVELVGGERFREGQISSSIPSEIGRRGAGGGKSIKGNRRKLIPLAPGEIGRALEHLLGYYYVQEISSMLPIIALQPKPNERLLDLCAAPGSKTTQAASAMNNTGTIVANEVKFGRLKVLKTNLERCGVANTIITQRDGIALCNQLAKREFFFNKILVDAPCSGEGTIRSTPKTFQMWNPKAILQLSALQKKLVTSAIQILKPGGTLLYSTCTHAPEENEAVVDFILKNFPEMKIETINLEMKTRKGILKWHEQSYVDDVQYACRVYPQDNDTEGFFLAKFTKKK